MATQRLTNDIRQSILSDVIKHAFQEKLNAMVLEEIQLASDVFDHVYKDDLELLSNSKPHLFYKSHGCKVVLGTDHHQLSFGSTSFNQYVWCQLPVSFKALEKSARPVPHAAANHRAIAQLTPTSKMGRRIARAEHINDQFVETVRTAVTSAEAILKSTASFKKLIEAWPEIESFAKPYMNRGSSNLPAVQTTALNAMLDIPV